MVVLTTSETSTTGMFPVLPDSTVSGGNVTAVFTGVGESGRHREASGRYDGGFERVETLEAEMPE